MQYSDEYHKIMAVLARAKQRMHMAVESRQGQEVLGHEIDFIHFTVHRAALRLDSLDEIKSIAQRAMVIIDSF